MDGAMVFADLERVRAKTPLVHNITNFVVMNNTANALLALGASPIMAHAPEELDELIAIVNALVLNIGTLSTPWIDSMLHAGRAAAARPIPVVLDPVGAGASSLRTNTALTILDECAPAVVRGNASEILALAGASGAASPERVAAAMAEAGGATRGVDSAHSGEGLADVAGALARRGRCVVVASGPTDTITDGERTMLVTGGHPLMPRVTGMGCTATAVIAAFAAVQGDPLRAAASAMAVMSAAGSVAAAGAEGPGSMQVRFLDALSSLTAEQAAAPALEEA